MNQSSAIALALLFSVQAHAQTAGQSATIYPSEPDREAEATAAANRAVRLETDKSSAKYAALVTSNERAQAEYKAALVENERLKAAAAQQAAAYDRALQQSLKEQAAYVVAKAAWQRQIENTSTPAAKPQSSTARPATKSGADDAPVKTVCRRVPRTGSIGTEKVCRNLPARSPSGSGAK